MEILFRELSSFYAEEIEGRSSNLPELPIQYADFAIWQHNFLKGAVVEKQLAYWSQVLKNAPPAVNLLTDLPRPASLSYRGANDAVKGSA